MQTSSCLPCSSTPLATQIPGPQGPAGPFPITTTTANFTIPLTGTNVTVSVVSTTPFIVGQNVFLGGVNYIIATINSPTSLTLTALGFPGDLSGITASGSVMVGGVGNFLNPIAITTQALLIPQANLGTVTVAVTNIGSFALGQNLFIGNPTLGANFLIQNFSGNSLVLLALGVSGDATAGFVIPQGAVVRSGIGNYGGTGGYAIVKDAWIVPAVNATLTISIGPVFFLNPFVVGQNVYYGGVNWIVTATDSGADILVTIKNLGFAGDTAPTTGIPPLTPIFGGTGHVSTFGNPPVSLEIPDNGTNVYTLITTIDQVIINAAPAQVTLANAGVYVLRAFARINAVGLTIPLQATATIKVNGILSKGNTGTAITNATDTSQIPNTSVAHTACNGNYVDIIIPPVTFTAAAGDVVGLMTKYTISSGSLVGTLVVPECWITATRIS